MSKHIAEVVEYTLERHPNADTLSIAKVKGWQCVVKTENFIDNEQDPFYCGLGVYIPLDMIAPADHPLLSFLEGKRLKTVKLRGELSQGVVLPLKTVCIQYLLKKLPAVGDDLTDLLGVKRWEPPVEAGSPTSVKGGGHEDVPRPAWLSKYTDIENWNHWNDVITPGTPVIIQEKLHGCLNQATQITLPDGNSKSIEELVQTQYRGYVLGFDGEKVVPTKVLNTFNNGNTTEWVNVRTTRHKAGRGAWFRSIKCTGSHKFFLPQEGIYREAKDLKPGDEVLSVRDDIGLNEVQKQILLGKMLGDGSLSASVGGTRSVTFGHKKAHTEYRDWTVRGLQDLAGVNPKDVISGYGVEMCRGKTIESSYIAQYFQSWITSEGKQVPSSVIKDLGPIALAFWYMDDGSLSHQPDQEDRANFAICAFNAQSVSNLVEAFKKFNIKATPYVASGYHRLRLNADEAEKFFILIAPYVPPSMQYKLPKRYRGGPGWLPECKSGYKRAVVIQKIESVIPIPTDRCRGRNSIKYDLETETHNFFANGILVHNSNAVYGIVNDEFYVCSRNRVLRTTEKKIYIPRHRWFKKFPKVYPFFSVKVLPAPDSVWHKVAEKYQMKEALETLQNITGAKNVALYGEVLGTQDLMYDVKKGDVGFYAFDIRLDENDYVRPESFLNLMEQIDMPVAPVLKLGPFEPEDLNLRLGKTLVGEVILPEKERHIREGIVIKPLEPLVHRSLGRVILKRISEDYLMRKNAKDR